MGVSKIKFADYIASRTPASLTGDALLPVISGGVAMKTTVADLLALAGDGDVVGPASAADNGVALYNGPTGKVIKSSPYFTFDPAGGASITTPLPLTGLYPGASLFSSLSDYDSPRSAAVGVMTGQNILVDYYGSGTVGLMYGTSAKAYNEASVSPAGEVYGSFFVGAQFGGQLSKIYGAWARGANAGGTAASVYGGHFSTDQSTTTTNAYGSYVDVPTGTAAVNNFAYWAGDQTGKGTNSYGFWYDSPGVWRIKADGVMAYYNPAFSPKYTPGATSYERVVQQWTANILQYGLEKGTDGGTLRKLQLIGAGLILSVDILPTSDPAVAGQLWRSGNDVKVSTG